MGYLADVFCCPGGNYTPDARSAVGWLLIIQGLFYQSHGITHMIAPLTYTVEWHGHQLMNEDWANAHTHKLFGFCVFYVGLFYFFTGLSDDKHFALCSTFLRPFIVVPFMGIYLGLFCGYLPANLAKYYIFWELMWPLITLVSATYRMEAGETAAGGGFGQYIRDVFCLKGGMFANDSFNAFDYFMIMQGCIYMVHGFAHCMIPDMWSYKIGGYFHFLTHKDTDEGFFRVFGFQVFYIGIFYVMNALCDDQHFELVTTFTRPVFVIPIIGGIMGLGGTLHGGFWLCMYYGAADTCFALLTLYCYNRTDMNTELGDTFKSGDAPQAKGKVRKSSIRIENKEGYTAGPAITSAAPTRELRPEYSLWAVCE